MFNNLDYKSYVILTSFTNSNDAFQVCEMYSGQRVKSLKSILTSIRNLLHVKVSTSRVVPINEVSYQILNLLDTARTTVTIRFFIINSASFLSFSVYLSLSLYNKLTSSKFAANDIAASSIVHTFLVSRSTIRRFFSLCEFLQRRLKVK